MYFNIVKMTESKSNVHNMCIDSFRHKNKAFPKTKMYHSLFHSLYTFAIVNYYPILRLLLLFYCFIVRVTGWRCPTELSTEL